MFGFNINMKNNAVSNISFKSNIRFIPSNTYEDLVKSTRAHVSTEMSKVSELYEISSYGSTKGIKYCLAGVMNNLTQKKKLLFHWYPTKMYEDYGFGQKRSNLLDIETQLKKMTKEKIRGFLIGGLSKSCDNEKLRNYLGPKSELSFKLLNCFKKILKPSQKRKLTVFFSQNPKNNWVPESAFMYSKANDTYYVRCKHGSDYFWKDLLTKEDIKNNFDYIKIADRDRVFIGLDSEEAIPNKFWNKNKFARAKK